MKFPTDPYEEELYARALDGDHVDLIGEPDRSAFWCFAVEDGPSMALITEDLMGFVDVEVFEDDVEFQVAWEDRHRNLYNTITTTKEDCHVVDY